MRRRRPTSPPERSVYGWIGVALAVALPASAPRHAEASACGNPSGDIDGDGALSVSDIICCLLATQWDLQPKPFWSGPFLLLMSWSAEAPPCATTAGVGRADQNCDSQITVEDALLVIHSVLDALVGVKVGGALTCEQACAPSCCDPHAEPGCALEACEACVCNFDPHCCEVGWDTICASAHVRRCALECGCLPLGPLGCCEPHAQPHCTDPPFEENTGASWCSTCRFDKEDNGPRYPWDTHALWIASTSCTDYCDCPPPELGDCCEPHFGHSCNVAGCTACVCESDEHCCSTLWDERCAESARKPPCDAACGCPPLPKEPCCAPHDSPGCVDAACEACVCAIDPECCDAMWDGLCAHRHSTKCETQCGCSTFANAAPCTAAHPGPGCIEEPCAKCVCARDHRCCLRDWDRTCVEQGKVHCAAACAGDP